MPEQNVILVKFVKIQRVGKALSAEFKHPTKGTVYWTKGYIQDILNKPLDPRNESELNKAMNAFNKIQSKKK